MWDWDSASLTSWLSNPIQYERAPLRVRCAMLRKHPPESPVLSCQVVLTSLTEFLFDERRIVSIAEEIPR